MGPSGCCAEEFGRLSNRSRAGRSRSESATASMKGLPRQRKLAAGQLTDSLEGTLVAALHLGRLRFQVLLFGPARRDLAGRDRHVDEPAGNLVVAPLVGEDLTLADDQVHADVRLDDGDAVFTCPGEDGLVLGLGLAAVGRNENDTGAVENKGPYDVRVPAIVADDESLRGRWACRRPAVWSRHG